MNRHKTKKYKALSKINKVFSSLGPGLITGAADDDPSGILTYSQSGAQFGFGQLWTAFFMLPFLIAVQEMAGRIGLVTKKGISKIIKEHYSKKVLYFIVIPLFIANTINIGADLGAMAAVSRLFFNVPFWLLAVFFFLLIMTLEVYIPYHKYAKILKWLTISLFAYILTGFIVGNNWAYVFKESFLPHFEFNFAFLVIIVGVFGTTISPYMFFWQAAQEVEEEEDRFAQTHKLMRAYKKYVANMRLDTFTGMFFSEITTWFIILATASVLNRNGITDIQTAAQAAKAFEPLVHNFPHAGFVSEFLFAIGIIGTGLLSIPVLAASSSYALSEVYDWSEGLAKKFKEAERFYLVIIIGTFIGLLMDFIGINPIKALVWTAIINGVVAVPLIFMLIKISNNKKIMHQNISGNWSKVFSYLAFFGMAAAVILTIYSLF